MGPDEPNEAELDFFNFTRDCLFSHEDFKSFWLDYERHEECVPRLAFKLLANIDKGELDDYEPWSKFEKDTYKRYLESVVNRKFQKIVLKSFLTITLATWMVDNIASLESYLAKVMSNHRNKDRRVFENKTFRPNTMLEFMISLYNHVMDSIGKKPFY